MTPEQSGLTITSKIPRLHPRSYFEPPVVIHANLAPDNLIQIGAFTGVYGGRLGHCKIGRYCSIAPGVDIASDQHPIDWLSSSMFQYVPNLHNWGAWLTSQGYTYHQPKTKFDSNSQVIIGNDVWIGQGVFIKSGVSIGDGAIIAAHSVVINDIPPYAIAAGVPAKVKRLRFKDDLIGKFLKIKWWDYQIIGQCDIDFSNAEMAIEKLEELIQTQKLDKYIIDNHKFDEI